MLKRFRVSYFFRAMNPTFKVNKEHLRLVPLFLQTKKKNTREDRRMHVKIYGNDTLINIDSKIEMLQKQINK